MIVSCGTVHCTKDFGLGRLSIAPESYWVYRTWISLHVNFMTTVNMSTDRHLSCVSIKFGLASKAISHAYENFIHYGISKICSNVNKSLYKLHTITELFIISVTRYCFGFYRDINTVYHAPRWSVYIMKRIVITLQNLSWYYYSIRLVI